MPNYFVFDQINSPLFTKQVNTFISPGIDSAPEAGAAMAGILFAANFSSNISAGQNLILHTSNPAANSKTMYISRVSGSASAAGTTVTLLKNGTVSGAVVTPVNLNFGSSNSSGMSVISATGSAAGSPTTFLTLILQAGEFVIDFTGRIVVPPGHSLTVTVGLGAANATANVNWWEY